LAIQTLFGSVPQEPNLLERLKAGIEKTRTGLVDRLEDVIAGRKEIDADLLDELEYTLITADIGVKTTSEILESIRQRADRKMVGDAQQIKLLIKEHLLEVLESVERPMPRVTEPPAVVVVVGVNGSGKTTTIGKLASRFKAEGHSVLLIRSAPLRLSNSRCGDRALPPTWSGNLRARTPARFFSTLCNQPKLAKWIM
jgi:fused signal recognition particle receptor